MKITSIQLYTVIESDDCLLITRAGNKLNGTHIELITSDMATCCEYLQRYMFERLQGKHIRDCHTRALKGTHVITPGTLDKPSVKVNGS